MTSLLQHFFAPDQTLVERVKWRDFVKVRRCVCVCK
jgi:hypothetical protein